MQTCRYIYIDDELTGNIKKPLSGGKPREPVAK
jgi:hypothetical protein